ncbi:hypothetical protein [Paenisporosarcina sp. TG20]|uniref:hypothetical protein n=1 Tax=Paenisporosarcina sp. TG20 TaxID=1211706 RepID=UPI00030E9000|nr:hypothetical protein [Paenisporosarcina sp. TG20]
MKNEKYVWYLSYGSNLSKDRFLCYIQGGTPNGSTKNERGCRDNTIPIRDEGYEISFPLYFAKFSSRWNGGVAFIGKSEKNNTKTFARMYLITEEQFLDVVSQENDVADISIDLEEVISNKSLQVSDGWYGNILYIGEKDGHPIFSFTSNDDIEDAKFNPPSKAYLDTISLGLTETFDMAQVAASNYLSSSKGCK